jgi:tetratricopeptide (TPR) repeat protein
MRFTGLLLTACCLIAQTADYERARQLLTSGHPAEAAAIYRELSRAHPEDSDALLNLSIAEYKAGNFREAAASAAAALKLNPDLQPAHLFLGASYLELGEFTSAIDPLQRVVAANPGERNGRLMLGEALLGAGQMEAAAEHLNAAAELLPANSRVWYGLGRTYEALGRKNDAAKAWDRLTSLPPSLESHLHAAEVHNAQQRWREAAVESSEALKLAPRNQTVRIGLAWSLFRSRDYEGAIAALKPLLSSEKADVQFLYGASLLNLQQPVEAIPYLRTAIARDAHLLSARAALGQALLQTGDPEKAIGLLADSISLDQDGSIHFQLFRAYQLTNRKAEAQRALADYQRLRASLPAAP